MIAEDKNDKFIKALDIKNNSLISSYAELDEYIKKHNIKKSIKATDKIFRCVNCNQFILLVIGKEKRNHFKHNKGNEQSKEKCIDEEKNQNKIKNNNILTNRPIIYINNIEQEKIVFSMYMPKSIIELLNENQSISFNGTTINKNNIIDDYYFLDYISSKYKVNTKNKNITLDGFFSFDSDYCIFNNERRLIRENNIIHIDNEVSYFFLIKNTNIQLKNYLDSILNNYGNEYLVKHHQIYSSCTEEIFHLYKININSLEEDALNFLKLKEKYRVLTKIFYSIIFPVFFTNNLNIKMNHTEFVFYANKKLNLYANEDKLLIAFDEKDEDDKRTYTLAQIKYASVTDNNVMYFATGLVNLDKEIFIQEVNSTPSIVPDSPNYEIDDNFLYFTTYIEGKAIIYKDDGTSYQRKLYCSDDSKPKYNRFNLNNIEKIYFYQGLDLIYTYEQKDQENSFDKFNESDFLQKLKVQYSNIKVYDIAPSIRVFYKKYPLINAFLVKSIKQKTLNQKQLRLLMNQSEYKNENKQ